MEIVQAIEEIPHVSSQDREHAIVTVLTDECYEVHAHLIEELLLRHAEYLKFIRIFSIIFTEINAQKIERFTRDFVSQIAN